jgi:hypothetical protein
MLPIGFTVGCGGGGEEDGSRARVDSSPARIFVTNAATRRPDDGGPFCTPGTVPAPMLRKLEWKYDCFVICESRGSVDLNLSPGQTRMVGYLPSTVYYFTATWSDGSYSWVWCSEAGQPEAGRFLVGGGTDLYLTFQAP